MKKTKKFISLFLSVLMMFSITVGTNLSVFALTSGDYEYTVLDDGTAQITEYLGSEENVDIPEKIDGYTVTTIAEYAFYNCSNLTSVTIPDSVTSIDDRAFNWCISIEKFIVDASNQYYTSDEGILFDKNKTTLIEFPAAKTDLTYTIPNSVTRLGKNSFSACKNLKSVVIPDGVTKITNSGFHMCSNLESIVIPKSVTYIEFNAFLGCNNLTDIYYTGTEEQWNNISFQAFEGNEEIMGVFSQATYHYNFVIDTDTTDSESISQNTDNDNTSGKSSTKSPYTGANESALVVLFALFCIFSVVTLVMYVKKKHGKHSNSIQ